MQAIVTKILPATNTRPTRIKAQCARGNLTFYLPAHMSAADESSHVDVASRLVAQFAEEDFDEYGTPQAENPWNARRVVGCLPNGDYVHVFVK